MCVTRQHSGRYTLELLRTHRTAQSSWLYISLSNAVTVSTTSGRRPTGRVATTSSSQVVPHPPGRTCRRWGEWAVDAHVATLRPDEPACAHAVGSLPLGEGVAGWRNLVAGYSENHLVSQGMVCDWAIHPFPKVRAGPRSCRRFT